MVPPTPAQGAYRCGARVHTAPHIGRLLLGEGAAPGALTSRVMVFPVRVFTKICMARPAPAGKENAVRGARGEGTGIGGGEANTHHRPARRMADAGKRALFGLHGVSSLGRGGASRSARRSAHALGRDYNSQHAPPAQATPGPPGDCGFHVGMKGDV